MAARIKTMNHFSPKLRPPDIISKYQSEISEVIHSLIRSPQCYQMPPHQTSDELVESGKIFYIIVCGYFPLGGWKVSCGRWLGRKMTPGTRDGDNQKEELSHSWHGDTLPSDIYHTLTAL